MPLWHFFRNWLDWPCPVSAALQNGSQDFFFSYTFKFLFIVLNMKPLSEVAPGLLAIQIQVQAVCLIHFLISIKYAENKFVHLKSKCEKQYLIQFVFCILTLGVS